MTGDSSLDALRAETTMLRAQVAELTASEARLREEIKREREINQRAPVSIYLYDLVERRSLYANRHITDVLGYTPEDIDRMGSGFIVDMVHPDERHLIPTQGARVAAAKDGDIVTIVNRMRHADGSWRWIHTQSTVFSRFPDGRVRSIIGAAQDVTALKESEINQVRMADEKQRQTDELAMFKALVANALDGIVVTEPKTHRFLYANPAFLSMCGIPGTVSGLSGADVLDPTEIPRLATEADPELTTKGRWEGLVLHRRSDGSRWKGQLSIFVLKDSLGNVVSLGAIVRDVTAKLRAEEERAELQARIIKAQEAALRELGTPLIPIADEVLAMPLVGAIDDVRAQQIMEVLLRGIASQRARVVILDITGVLVVDTEVAHALIRAAQAARLLGARVVLTGIGPELAQTLVGMGIELTGIVTRGTFQSGIAHAFVELSSSQSSLQ